MTKWAPQTTNRVCSQKWNWCWAGGVGGKVQEAQVVAVTFKFNLFPEDPRLPLLQVDTYYIVFMQNIEITYVYSKCDRRIIFETKMI